MDTDREETTAQAPPPAGSEKPRRVITKRAKRLAAKTARQWNDRDVGIYASSIAFYFFTSMIPLLVIVLQLLPLVGLSQVELLAFIDRLIPETAHGFAATIVSEAYKSARGALPLSALALIWSASRGTMALRQGLNSVYGEKETRPYPVLCLIAIGYTAAMAVLFSLMLFLMFAGPASHYLMQQMPELFRNPVTIELRQKILLQISIILIFALVYTTVPAGSRSFVRQLPGAFLVSVLWNIFSRLFSIYVQKYNAYTLLYGSLGTIVMFLFWLYCCFFILLTGAFFNCFCAERWDRAVRAVRKYRAGRR